MGKVKVRGFTVVRDVFGADVVEVPISDGQTVGDVLRALLDRYGERLKSVLAEPATGTLTAFPIRLNDEIINSTQSASRQVEDGDEMAIIFPVGGG